MMFSAVKSRFSLFFSPILFSYSFLLFSSLLSYPPLSSLLFFSHNCSLFFSVSCFASPAVNYSTDIPKAKDATPIQIKDTEANINTNKDVALSSDLALAFESILSLHTGTSESLANAGDNVMKRFESVLRPACESARGSSFMTIQVQSRHTPINDNSRTSCTVLYSIFSTVQLMSVDCRL